MSKFLLYIHEWFPQENEIVSQHVIEAPDRQMVKYWYHRVMRENGYTDASWESGKHFLELWEAGHATDIESITELSDAEYTVLKEYLPAWSQN